MNNQFPSSRPVEILLVEDNPADVELTIEALESGRILNHVTLARDGVEAMAILRKQPPYADYPRPDIVLLDLNLPRKDGFAVLADVKSDPALASIPVIILTTSNADRDIVRSYDLSANCYVCKPVELDEFLKFIRTTQEFWLQIVRLPPPVSSAPNAL